METLPHDVDLSAYTIIREPLPTRESRIIFKGEKGVDYRSHSIKLAVRASYPSAPLIIMSHGGGVQMISLNSTGWGVGFHAFEAIKDLPDLALYSILYAIWSAAYEANQEASKRTANKYFSAFCQGRLKKRRRNGRYTAEIALAYRAVVDGQELEPCFKTVDEALAYGRLNSAEGAKVSATGRQ